MNSVLALSWHGKDGYTAVVTGYFTYNYNILPHNGNEEIHFIAQRNYSACMGSFLMERTLWSTPNLAHTDY